MKTWKAILALLLVAALMLTLFAACGTSEEPSDNSGAPIIEDDETTEIKMILFDFNSSGIDHADRITEAVNALTVPEINVSADITFMSMGDFVSKVQMTIAGGEQVDLLSACTANNASTLYQAGMLMEVGELLETYAPEALNVVGDYITCYTYDGGVYGLPTYRNLLTCRWIIMNQDVLDELGLTEKADSMTTWSEFEEILQAVKDNKTDAGMYPIISNTGTVWQGALFSSDTLNTEAYDTLGDNVYSVYTDQDGTVSLLPGQDSWVYANELAASWNEKGYIYPDSIYNVTLSGNDLMNQGVTFSLICSSEFGVEKSTNYSVPIYAKQISEPLLSTSSLTTWGMGVPVTAEEPEAACKFLNMLYTNADLMNVLVNGQQDVDYELVDGQVSYIENGYRGGNFVFGNNLLLTPSLGQGADFNEVVAEQMKTMQSSAYLGFTIDTSELELPISQISAVNDQYRTSLCGGEYNEATYNEYIEKLETAGVQEYLDAVQTQLDAWLAQ